MPRAISSISGQTLTENTLTLLSYATRATWIVSPFSFTWMGHRSETLPPRLRSCLSAETRRSFLHQQIQNHLYDRFYCAGGLRPGAAGYQPPPQTDRAFLQELDQANQGTGCLDPGWTVSQSGEAELLVHRDGLSLRVGEKDVVRDDNGKARIRLPRGLPRAWPCYYLALGNVALSETDWRTLIRVYWNITAAGAARLVRRLTAQLNEAGIPFRLKVSSALSRRRRCDAAVLYLAADAYDDALPYLAEASSEVRVETQDAVPLFTKRLAAGVGFAENPVGGQSFGMHRCGVLAEGIMQAHDRGVTAHDARVQMVTSAFDHAKIDIQRPYLNHGTPDRFHELPRPPGSDRTRQGDHGLPAASTPLTTARAIGKLLVDSAFWSRNRCSWIGPTLPTAGDTEYHPLPADLYKGTAGIALFLVELAAHTGDQEALRTALGAAREAVFRAREIANHEIGLYTGRLGVAATAAYVAQIAGDDALGASADALAGAIPQDALTLAEFDLLGGIAGAIIARLVLHAVTGRVDHLSLAERLSADLMRGANLAHGEASWPSRQAPHLPDLLGFSHGTAGIAHALLELFVYTGTPALRDFAERAFAYERRWFETDARNWPNLHEILSFRDGKTELLFLTYWCHGAPGAALSRIRAYEILGVDTTLEEALDALGTTCASIDCGQAFDDYCLCHGAAGRADVLIEGARSLPSANPRWDTLAREVATRLTAEFANGTLVGGVTAPIRSPGLMLGLAGIGHYLLRCSCAEIPSVLLIRPAAFADRVQSCHIRS